MPEAGGSDADRRYMGRALELAGAGWGRVHPNPLVGAVVVRDGEVVGEGAHREFGGPHAEIEALAAAGERARGATLYVTLEPCAHHGKTPPCTTAILESGVRRVVFAVADPNPDAAGGSALLADRGLDVAAGVGRAEARHRNALFLGPLESGRPFVAVKLALSLDARIARAAGERTDVTGTEARTEVHRLRAGFDAVLVGARTARIDDPLLTVREARRPRVPPLRVVADPGARLGLDSALVRSVDEAPVAVVVGPDADEGRIRALEAAGVGVWRADAGPGGLDMEAVLGRLWEEGIRTIFCEGGGLLAASLLQAGRVDRLYLFYAPSLFGTDGVPAFPGVGGFGGELVETRAVGRDVLMVIDRSG